MKNSEFLDSTAAAAALGSIKTPRKTASSAVNIRRAQAARQANRKKLSEIVCNCGAGSVLDKQKHKGTCPMYQAIYYREQKGLPLQ